MAALIKLHWDCYLYCSRNCCLRALKWFHIRVYRGCKGVMVLKDADAQLKTFLYIATSRPNYYSSL